MKNMKKSLLVLALAFVMIFGLAGVAMADDVATADVSGYFVIAEESGYTYENGTLTINKAGTYNISMYTAGSITDDVIEVKASGNVTLNFVGVEIETTASTIIDATYMEGDSTLTIDGDVSLTSSVDSGTAYGIYAGSGVNVNISGGDVDIDVTGSGSVSVTGIYTKNTGAGNINIADDAVVTIDVTGALDVDGINAANGDVTIGGGSVTVTAETTGNSTVCGIEANENVEISGGTVTIDVNGAAKVRGIAAVGNVEISGGDVTVIGNVVDGFVTGIFSQDYDVEISGGSVTVTATSTGSGAVYGIYAAGSNGDVNISGGDVDIDATSTGSGAVYGIQTYTTNGNVNISGGTVTIDADGVGAVTGIFANSGYVSVSDNANLTINANSTGGSAKGISVSDIVEISDNAVVTIVVEGTSTTVISGDAGVSISGGTVTITATLCDDATGQVYGISTYGSVDISGGSVVIGVDGTGAVYGVYTYPNYGNVEISGGTVDVDAYSTGAGVSGIESGDVLTISGGTVTVISETTSNSTADGIYAHNNLKITAGTVTVEAKGAYVYSVKANNGDLTISGGTVKVTATGTVSGNVRGIQADNGNLEISGGTVKVTASNGDTGTGTICAVHAKTIVENSNLVVKAMVDEDYTEEVVIKAVGVYFTYVLTDDDGVATNTIANNIKMTFTYVNYTYYDIDLSYSGEGKIVPTGGDSGVITTAEGGSRMFTFTPADGYEIADVIIDGESVGVVDEYYFANISADHTLEVEFVSIDSAVEDIDNSLATLDEDLYYYETIQWALKLQMIYEEVETVDSILEEATRAESVYFIWMANGHPTSTIENPFTDIEVESYYYEAVLWAYEKGITAGTTDTTFSPDGVCTRAEIASFIYRADIYLANLEVGENDFADINANAYYYDAVAALASIDVIAGVSSEAFDPDSDCARVEIMSFLYRYFLWV